MPYKPQRIRDPLHNLIEFSATEFENAIWDVIETRPFQRLRRIKQLGFSDFVYPGATHSRFAHSVGVFHTARMLMKRVEELLGKTEFKETKAHVALAAALVHDLGHGPFSHAFEDVGRRLKLKMADHEYVSDLLIRESEVAGRHNALGSGTANDVAAVVKGSGVDLYGAVVSSQFDADRLDYMRRDRLMSGSEHSQIDFPWLVANLEVGDVQHGVDERRLQPVKTFVLGPKAIYAAEAYILGLFQLYPTVYQHKTTRGAEKLFTELFFRAIKLVQDGSVRKTGLPKGHPIARFALDPDSVDVILTLDDSVVCGALPMMELAGNEVISDLAMRLLERKLYKAVDVREILTHRFGPKPQGNPSLIDEACASIVAKVEEWVLQHENGSPRILQDQGVRIPYKRFQESHTPLNQVMVRTRSGVLVDLGERSEVVKAIEPFQFFRLYVPEDDDEARKFIGSLIDGEIENGARS